MSGSTRVPDHDLLTKNEKTAIIGRVRRRMIWKLVAVVIVVASYVSLRALETATQSFEDERERPIVLVGEEVARENATKASDAVTVRHGCDPLYNPNLPPPKKRYNEALVRLCAVQGSINVSGVAENEAVKKKLGRLENEYFPDEQALINRLVHEIRTEAEWRKRALRATEEAENKSRASKLPSISTTEALVDEALRKTGFASQSLQGASSEEIKEELHASIEEQWENLPEDKRQASEKQIQAWQKRLTSATDASSPPLEINQLLVLHQSIVDQSNYEERLRLLNEEKTQIENKAQKQINIVYEKLKPSLSELIRVSPGAPNLPANNEVRAWFNPRSLLDPKSGAHVIYETVQLTLSMVLVLGVIFLFVLILRFLPFFQGGTDQLKEQTKAFLQRSGGTVPPIAKSLVATASALAIGTAVVVAGNKAINPPIDDGTSYDAGYHNREGEKRPPGERPFGPGKTPPNPPGGCPDCEEFPPYPPDDRVDLHLVKLEEPIAYPSPITVSSTNQLTLTSESVSEIKLAIQELFKIAKGPAAIPDAELELRIRTITDRVVTDKLTTITSACCKASGDQGVGSEAFLKLLQPTFSTIESIRKDLDETKQTIQQMQSKQFQPNTDSGGRGLVTRTKQFFKGDRYLVTREMVEDLKVLMRKLPTDCQSTTVPGEKCCGGTSVKTAYCQDMKTDTILSRLASMIGNPPTSESDFMKGLRAPNTKGEAVDKTTVDKWKSVILRYARVPY